MLAVFVSMNPATVWLRSEGGQCVAYDHPIICRTQSTCSVCLFTTIHKVNISEGPNSNIIISPDSHSFKTLLKEADKPITRAAKRGFH